MTRYIQHIGIILLTIFTVSLALQSAAKAHHLLKLNNKHTDTEWFTGCQKDTLTTIGDQQGPIEITHPRPSQEETKTTVNTPCHTSLYLLQTLGTILYNPMDGNIFSNRIASIHSQLFVSPISDPPQPIS